MYLYAEIEQRLVLWYLVILHVYVLSHLKIVMPFFTISAVKITTSFVGQRTNVGRFQQGFQQIQVWLKPLTARHKWQLEYFVFSKDHIKPQTLRFDKEEVGYHENEQELETVV